MGIFVSGSVNTDVSSIFYATYGTTTYQEIVQAYNDGKFILVSRPLNGTTFYSLADINSSGTYYFRTFSSAANTNYGCYITSDGTWSVNSYSYAALSSPSFTGTPTAPTAASGTDTTQIATTAFVQDAISSSGGAWTVVATIPVSVTNTAAKGSNTKIATLGNANNYVTRTISSKYSIYRWKYVGTITSSSAGSHGVYCMSYSSSYSWSDFFTSGTSYNTTIISNAVMLYYGPSDSSATTFPVTPTHSRFDSMTSYYLGKYAYVSSSSWSYPDFNFTVYSSSTNSSSSTTLSGTLYLEAI